MYVSISSISSIYLCSYVSMYVSISSIYLCSYVSMYVSMYLSIYLSKPAQQNIDKL